MNTDLVITSVENELENSCEAYSGSGDSKTKIFGNYDLTEPITSLSTELYFDGKVCAFDAKVNKNANLVYEANLGTLFQPDDDIVTYNNMQWTKITCQYSSTVEGLGF